ncbi:hypothetical protein [Piscinibacter sp. HJYY11]|uniref:hypothetical protein n=1 Tax=Piscinibacter sp. HJYY11 TaxID=2801333 RepID=UPI00191E3A7D|nr:hypothetical protein [Piscinibacter sp. HJYY11]MBL0731216.1 hypothetical protein [Piscinibacter sp. HJYY11]
MATNADGSAKLQDVNPSTHLSFEPFGIEFDDGTTIAVQPFTWNDVALQINITLPAEPVEEWAMRWLDADDSFAQDEHGLQGVIHSIVRSDGSDGGTLLTIDFGSSPVEALRELVELAVASGASHLSIYSETLQ